MTAVSLGKHIARFLDAQKLTGTVGVVAISGGPDSVCLAALLLALSGQGYLSKLQLAHLNHGLRGADSDADEALVRDLADRWCVPLSVERLDVAEHARRERCNLEDSARRVRYAWLADVAHRSGATWVATGHTADDQAETVLHHVLRGSGLAGLAGMAPRRILAPSVSLIRPLLDVSRQDLLEFVAAERLPFREDESNRDFRFTRSRLRHQLIPLLVRDYNSAIVQVLNRLGTQAAECQAAVSQESLRHMGSVEKPRAGDVLVLDREALAALGGFWIRELFRAVWRREGWPEGEMTFDDWNRLVGLAASECARHDFPAGVRARSTRHVIQLWRE